MWEKASYVTQDVENDLEPIIKLLLDHTGLRKL